MVDGKGVRAGEREGYIEREYSFLEFKNIRIKRFWTWGDLRLKLLNHPWNTRILAQEKEKKRKSSRRFIDIL